MSARYALQGGIFGCASRSFRSPKVVLSQSLLSRSINNNALARSHLQKWQVNSIKSGRLALPSPSRRIHISPILYLAERESVNKPKTSSNDTQKEPPLPSKVTSSYEPEKLSEDILTVPNVLTILRLASTPVLGYLILIDEMPYALGLLAVSGFTDVLDGWLARRFKSATVFGSIADPAADKALMTVMVGALAWRGMIPIPLVLLIVGRDLALVVSAFLIRYRSLPEPKTFARYWDPRLPSAKVEPTQVSKYNTFLQIILVAGCTLIASFNENWRQWWNEKQGLWNDKVEGSTSTSKQDWGDLAKKAWHGFMIVVSFTTVWSGASYTIGSRGVSYLGQKAKNKAQAMAGRKASK